MQHDIILFGTPGAGKGTQAELIVDQYAQEFSWLSTGDVFRALTAKPNAIGDHIQEELENGALIADDITIGLFNAYFHATLDAGKRMLLDGYPRSLEQLDALISLSEKYGRTLRGLFFSLSEEESIERMKHRGRKGEDNTVISKRFDEYNEHTQPLIDTFGRKCELITIDGSPSVQDIYTVVKNYL